MFIGICTRENMNNRAAFATFPERNNMRCTLSVCLVVFCFFPIYAAERIPESQADFIKVVSDSYEKFKTQKNERQQERVRRERGENVRAMLIRLHATHPAEEDEIANWRGVLEDFSIISEGIDSGRGVVSIIINEDPFITLSTFESSDEEDFYYYRARMEREETAIILRSHPFYETLSKLKSGDKIIFSGKFLTDFNEIGVGVNVIKEESRTMEMSMKAPNYLIQLISVEKQ